MRHTRRVRRSNFPVLAALAGILLVPVGASAPVAQVYSVDPDSPLAAAPGGSAANLYLPGPALYTSAGAIGLLAGDDIDALSFGFDGDGSLVFNFSTGFATSGALIPGNAVCAEAGTCSPAAPCAPETAADVFNTSGSGTASLRFDGDGVPGTAPPLGLAECPAGGPGVQDNVDAFDDLVAPLVEGEPAWRIYFSLAPGSPTLAGANPLLPGGAGAADVLVYDPGQDSVSVFLSAAELGLLAGDDIDGLSLHVLDGELIFSLSPGSPSLAAAAGICTDGCSPGDLLRAAGTLCGSIPCLAGGLGFASAGLAPEDNVDAVDRPSSPPPFAFDDVSPGKTYSVDAQSPVLDAVQVKSPSRKGSGADLLTQDSKNPTGSPRVVYRAESLGLLPGDDIDGLSFGLEPVFSPGKHYAVEFSVDRAAVGAPMTAVLAESSAPKGAEASSDVFDTFLPAGGPPPLTNRQVWDGDGSSAPTLQLREVHLGTVRDNDDVDALEGPPGIVDPDADGVRDFPIYFSLAPGSPTLSGANPLLSGVASPGDILVSPAPFAEPSVFIFIAASDGTLGLGSMDNLQDFALDAATGNLDFTLPTGLTTAPGSGPGSIFKRGGFAPCTGASPCEIMAPAAAGLLGSDDMNALDALDPVRVCVTIEAGADPTIHVSHGACGMPFAGGPFDVIEGEIGELTEKPSGVNLSRTFCHADNWPFDRITLDGGVDPLTRIRFILVKNAGAPDYGVSSAGNPRKPDAGDCP